MFEEIAPQGGSFRLDTRSAAFFLCERLLVSVRAVDKLSFDRLKQRFATGATRSPTNVRSCAR